MNDVAKAKEVGDRLFAAGYDYEQTRDGIPSRQLATPSDTWVFEAWHRNHPAKPLVCKYTTLDAKDYVFVTRLLPQLIDTPLLRHFIQFMYATKFKSGDYFRSVLVSPRYGPDFEQVVTTHGPFPQPTVGRVVDTIMNIMEKLHSRYIFKVVKPANVVVERYGDEDVKWSRVADEFRIVDTDGVMAIRGDLPRPYVGASPAWASRHWTDGHVSNEIGEDYDSLVYFACYLLKGTLPWTNVPPTSEYKNWARMKHDFDPRKFLTTSALTRRLGAIYDHRADDRFKRSDDRPAREDNLPKRKSIASTRRS